ncbi:MAG TPA: fused MFS/spermidine synthase [Thermoanaerobaculia bacterium]
MKSRVAWVGLLLFGSGGCALIYQTVWLRQFRLVFGASTLASAAVLAIFMGGLGIGGLFIGRRVDQSRNPLLFYGLLEVGVASSAVLSPLLLWIVRQLYLAMGGSFVLGSFLATVVRLLLSVIVLAIPTVLMGGTLPAASRAVETSGDAGRLGVSILYATNTLGAVAGTVISTFYLLETFGNLKTLIAAALLNALVGMSAIAYSNAIRRPADSKSRALGDEIARIEIRDSGFASAAPGTPNLESRTPNPSFIYSAAFATGFAFFLLELVWYRMLTPLLGGTTYTFGLILAVGLAGVGLGSFAYAIVRRSQATIGMFAVLCALEALAIAVPFALGDSLAFTALLLRPLGSISFGGYVIGWAAVTAIVVFPASFIAGIQFPVLISLLGTGREDVGTHVGTAYLWNTAGAITGSIAGGFGLMPLLTAPGTWRTAVVVLAAIVVAAVLMTRKPLLALGSAVTIAIAIALLFATGPTAFWRHSPIGAGRVYIVKSTRNNLIDFQHLRQRTTAWEAEGIETSVSVANSDGYAFIVNGKSDGHARLDAGTQVMGAILPALLHPNPRRAAVVGLGTGSTAGWLAAVPSIERVDAVEIEPAIVNVAEMCTPVNHDFLHNPKGHTWVGDGREFLLARGDRFDIISSEPSNPYRAGIANLFTTEFYRACAARLNRRGILVQFLQAYEIDAPTIRTIYATITGVFPEVETWQSESGDLLLVASLEPIDHRWDVVDRRMQLEPYRSAARNAWAVNDTAGIYARYVCGTATARRLGTGARPNTDDRTIVEYAFARTLGQGDAFGVNELRAFARGRADDLPNSVRTVPAAAFVEAERLSIGVAHDAPIDIHNLLPTDLRSRGVAQLRYMENAPGDAWLIWQGIAPPRTPLEMITYADVLAERGDENAMKYIDALRPELPMEADVLLARLRWREKRPEAVAILARVFEAYRHNPWLLPVLARHALSLAVEIAEDPQFAAAGPMLYTSLREPFAIEMFNEQRKSALLFIAQRLANGGCSHAVLDELRSYEPHVPWQMIYLQKRATCYAEAGDPRANAAARDLKNFERYEKKPLDALAR